MTAKKAAKQPTKKIAATKRVAPKPSTRKTLSTKSRKPESPSAKAPGPKATKPELTDSKVQNSSSFAKAESKAKEYAKDPKKLHQLFEDAAEKARETPKGPFGETWAYLHAMIRLIRAYANDTYREIPVASLLMILVAVIYFVSPIDFIPDFIPVAGFIDDALVISLALKQVKVDLDAFMDWELTNS